ncbi:NAD(P)-dependent alcohol dehydrogenase [Methanosphaerula palustris]|uniref:Alcohol dehydrogenase zinc-binding domain protein n=1 Tax=Methanosphaerula palustris (strain ATCC BAA-1556 / DSM 19958 / E1-9c) TaxID=521011 RepID=B8GHY9_METPE|nr:NAD(P)-dependent alcohol dehydrogenase [Methanosphaerula palustris]ACL16729.1 Alcohol dehydrogenase zinc-binding domain protein [Methanosphaerula palustris E1-9c]
MKGLARTGRGAPGWVEKVKPVAGPRDAIIRAIAIAPCNSDVHLIWGEMGDFLPSDRIFGHEAVGVVDSVGNDVKDFKVGDRVVVPAITPDWGTVASQQGNHQHCSGPLTGMPFDMLKDGTFAEYFHVNDADANLTLLPDGVTLEQAVMVVDMMTTGFYGAEMADVKLGSTVAVFGIGPVGLMAVAGAHLMGAARILAVGSRSNCVDLAKEYGATDIVDYHKGDTVKQIMDLTDGKGVDAVVVAGGNASTIGEGLEVLKFGHTLANLNVMEEAMLPIPLAPMAFGLGGKTIKGNLCPGGRARMEQMLALVKAGRVDPGKLINYRYTKFEDLLPALMVMHDKPKDLIKSAVILE